MSGLVYRSALGALQLAIRERLAGLLKSEDGVEVKIYDRAPRDAKGTIAGKYPFVTIGKSETTNDFSTKTNSGQRISTLVEIWSNYQGNLEAVRLATEVTQTLTERELALTQGYRVVLHRRTNEKPIDDPDGTIQHWALTFEFWICDAATFQPGLGG